MSTQRRDPETPDLSSPQLPQDCHASQLPTWKTYLLLGILLFIIFYWMIPAWLNYELGTFHNSTARPIASALLTRHIDWMQLAGITSSSTCAFLAARSYLSLLTTSKGGGNHLEFFNRLLARFIE